MFKVVDIKTDEVLFESEVFEEAKNMAMFFDEDCRIDN